MYENRDSNKAICVSHHDVRRHFAGEKCKARVLTKEQQVIMDFGIMDDDDATLLNILLDGKGLGSHERVHKFRWANGHTHTF